MLKYNIIPKPNNYTSKDGTYVISSNTEVLCSPEFVSAGKMCIRDSLTSLLISK